MIEIARDLIVTEVDDVALRHPNLPQNIKNKVRSTKQLIEHFKKIGDLYEYMKRFRSIPEHGQDETYDSFKELGLKAYEDIYPIFEEKFKYYLNDITTLDEFVIGGTYTSWDISIFSKQYNNQRGIYLIGDAPNYHAIFIKVTMHNGKYPNEWIDEGQELKYFMKSVKVGTQEQFKRQYKDNSAIINSADTPIYVFIKNNTDLKLEGIFSYVDDHTEPDDSKWFRLRKRDVLNMSTSMTMKEYDKQLSKEVAFSSSLSSQERLRRIALQLREPQRIKVITTQYKRSSDVIVEALLRANGVCEICGNSAPFKKASDGSPYLEVHHVMPLSQGGADILENVLAICPNCHRKEHFG